MRTTTILFLVAAAALCVASTAAWAAGDQELDLERGEELFQLCAQCHGSAGQGMRLALAPAIAGLSDWYVELQLNNFRSGARGLDPHDVAGLRMYPMSRAIRSEADVKLLAAYVSGLPRVHSKPEVEGGDAERGKQLYVTCSACHGPGGEGMEAVGGPNLTVTNDWYMLTQLHNYSSGIRGTNDADLAGKRMRPMAMTLKDDQAMRDVVAYIMTLRR
jgi:cytochrome c553